MFSDHTSETVRGRNLKTQQLSVILENHVIIVTPSPEGGTRYILGWGGAAWPLIP